MKREIKFRGKSVDNNEWVYGDLIHIGNGCIIYQGSQSDYEITNKTGVAIELFDDEVSVVRPETLGQFTGLCDKNGKEIYEGGIVRVYAKDGTFNVVVKWSNDSMAFMACYVDGNQSPFSWFTNLLVYELEVIGNIHDNPNLLKENNYE